MSETETSPSSWGRVLKWIRWFHGYLGLFLIPWVLLYGVTGFLFNHPDAFPDHDVVCMNLQNNGTAVLSAFPSPDSAAAMTLRAYAQKTGKTLEAAPELRARYMEPARFSGRNGEKDCFLIADVQGGTGRMRAYTRPAAPPLARPVWFDLQDSLSERATADAGRLMSKDSAAKVKFDGGPHLRFHALRDGVPYCADYDIGQGKFQITPDSGWPARLTFREYLLRLHTHRLYPFTPGVATLWAFFMDVVTVSMVLWALTGLLMWYQRRNTRRTGLVVICVSLLWGLAMGYWMWEMFRRM